MTTPAGRRRPRWLLPALPATLLGVGIAHLGLIVLQDLVQGSETEHSPLRALLFLLAPALLLTWVALVLRRLH